MNPNPNCWVMIGPHNSSFNKDDSKIPVCDCWAGESPSLLCLPY